MPLLCNILVIKYLQRRNDHWQRSNVGKPALFGLLERRLQKKAAAKAAATESVEFLPRLLPAADQPEQETSAANDEQGRRTRLGNRNQAFKAIRKFVRMTNNAHRRKRAR